MCVKVATVRHRIPLVISTTIFMLTLIMVLPQLIANVLGVHTHVKARRNTMYMLCTFDRTKHGSCKWHSV